MSTPKNTAFKARRMYSSRIGLTCTHSFGVVSRQAIPSDIPVAVLDVSDVPAILRQAAISICKARNDSWTKESSVDYAHYALVTLQSLGIIPPPKKGRK